MVIALVGAVAVSSAVMHGAELPFLFSMTFASASVFGVLAGRRIAKSLGFKNGAAHFCCNVIWCSDEFFCGNQCKQVYLTRLFMQT